MAFDGSEVIAELDREDYQAVLTDSRKFSALLNYYLDGRKERMTAWRKQLVPGNHYELVQPYQAYGESPVLYVTSREITEELVGKFEKTVFVGRREIPAGESRQIYLYRLDGFKL